ncbi:MAG: hypothetical protein WBM00_06270 [Solirubrobacterales bacterium]
MREKLNNNPLAQVVVIGVLLVATGFFVMSSMGGGEEESASATSETATTTTGSLETAPVGLTAAGTATAPAPGALAGSAPPPPPAVTEAFAADQTVVLLFVRNGGIDDRMVAAATARLAGLSAVSIFVIPVSRIARYAAIAQGVNVNRVPALVVIRPKRLNEGIPTAVVKYGFQSPESVVQAVVDAGYNGPTLDYHP